MEVVTAIIGLMIGTIIGIWLNPFDGLAKDYLICKLKLYKMEYKKYWGKEPIQAEMKQFIEDVVKKNKLN